MSHIILLLQQSRNSKVNDQVVQDEMSFSGIVAADVETMHLPSSKTIGKL